MQIHHKLKCPDKNVFLSFIVYLLSFFIPASLFYLAYVSLGIGFHEKTTVLNLGMQTQYMPFIASIRYFFENPGNLLFNWNYCLGGNYMGVVAYYLGSPLNLLTIFWDLSDIADAMLMLELVKAGLCGLTMCFLLKTKCQEEKKMSIQVLVFSTCYALMSYAIVYSMCTMWIDAMIILPVVIWGIDCLLQGKNGFGFLIGIVYIFIANYYMSYMVGVFSAFYFVFRACTEISKQNYKEYLKYAAKFGLYTVLALGIAAPLILPAISNVKYRYVGGALLENSGDFNPFSMSGYVKKLLPSQYGSYADIYCGSVIVILVCVYFFQKRNRKEKMFSFLLMFVVFLGFCFEEVDYMWHGFKYPHAYPYRYAFLFSFALILTAFEAWNAMAFRSKRGKMIGYLITGYTFVELFLNATAMIGGINQGAYYDTKMLHNVRYESYTPLAVEISNENDFYRMSHRVKDYGTYLNYSTMYGLNGTDFFSSSAHNSVSVFMRQMGTIEAPAMVSTKGFTPLMDSLFGIKYLIVDKADYLWYEKTADEVMFSLFYNKDALSLGFGIPQNNLEKQWGENPFVNQSMLLEYFGVEDAPVYKELPYVTERTNIDGVPGVEVTFSSNLDNPICFYLSNIKENQYPKVILDGKELEDCTDKVNVLWDLSATEKHSLVLIGEDINTLSLYLYEFDKDVCYEVISKLSEQQLENIQYQGNKISATVNAKNDITLFVSLPYDDGYTVYVDGKRTPYHQELDTFMGIEVPAGEHAVKLVYMPPGLLPGVFMCLISLSGAVGIFIIVPIITKGKKEKR